ncbi:MAG: hypothetical protein ACRDYU_10625 [Actinomycetes bacterium]
MGQGFDVDTTELSGLVDDLDEVGKALYAHRGDLDSAPDAGRSSAETAQALTALAATLAGLAEHLGSLSDSLRDTVATYEQADSGTDERFRGFR